MRYRTKLPLALLAFLCSSFMSVNAQTQPNFFVIMVDDIAFEDIGFYNDSVGKDSSGLIETPNIDLMATHSARFTNFYVTPICATSRASLLTGRHALKTGVYGVHGGSDFMHLDESTIAEGMKAGGYTTGFFGKWHSGKTSGYFPWDRGFDHAHMADLYKYYNNRMLYNGNFVSTTGHVETVLADLAIDFISANAADPFFVLYCPITAHGGRENLNPDLEGENRWISPGYWYHYYLREFDQDSTLLGDSLEQDELARLYGSISFLDQELGRIFAAFDSLGLAENTVFMLMSDNGPASFELDPEDALWQQIRCPMGMERSKAHVWENGIRSFFFVHRPGPSGIPAADIHENVGVQDIFPTVLEMSGTTFTPADSFDGVSFAPLLDGLPWAHDDRYLYFTRAEEASFILYDDLFELDSSREILKPQPLLEFKEKYAAIRQGDFKLINRRLFDIAEEDHIEFIESKDPIKNDLIFEIQRWWEYDILAAPHSFEPPVFQLNWEGEIVSEVLLYAAVDGSDSLDFANFGSSGFKREGDFVSVRYNAHAAGFYSPRVTTQEAEVPAGMTCMITNGSDTAYKNVNLINRIDFAPIYFPAGPGEIKFQLTSLADTNFTQLFRRIQKLLLTYQGPLKEFDESAADLTSALTIFPNPAASSHIYISTELREAEPQEVELQEVELQDVSEEAQLEFFSVDGKLISSSWTELRPNEATQVEIGFLPAGMYALRIRGNDWQTTELLVVE